MSKLFIPKEYTPLLDPTETQRAIKRIKDHFQKELAHGLNLGRGQHLCLLSLRRDSTIL